jgi:adenine-specific DNA methylase
LLGPVKDKRTKLSELKLTHETDPVKAEQLKEAIEKLKTEIEVDEAQLEFLLEDILFHCSGH